VVSRPAITNKVDMTLSAVMCPKGAISLVARAQDEYYDDRVSD